MRNWRSGNDSVVTKTVLVSLKPSDWSPISPISQCETWCLLKLFIMPVQFPFYTMVVRKPMWCRREASTLGRCQCSATTQLKNARVDWCDCLWSQDQQILFEWNATSTFIQLVWSGNVFTADIKSSRHQETHFSKLTKVRLLLFYCCPPVHLSVAAVPSTTEFGRRSFTPSALRLWAIKRGAKQAQSNHNKFTCWQLLRSLNYESLVNHVN